MRAATRRYFSFSRDLLICFRVWVGVTSASLLRRGCTVFGSVRGDFLQTFVHTHLARAATALCANAFRSTQPLLHHHA